MLLLYVRNVTIDEFNSLDHPRLHLTSETLTWDSSSTLYEQQETAMTDYFGNIISNAIMRGPSQTLIMNELHSLTTNMADMTHDYNFHQVLASHIVISNVDANLNGHVWSRRSAPINFKTLAARWMVSPEHAKRTVQLTTQRGVHTCLNPTLARRFPTNNRMLRYKRLPQTVFTDTMFAGMPSPSGNKFLYGGVIAVLWYSYWSWGLVLRVLARERK